jgi:hypothetical protein
MVADNKFVHELLAGTYDAFIIDSILPPSYEKIDM